MTTYRVGQLSLAGQTKRGVNGAGGFFGVGQRDDDADFDFTSGNHADVDAVAGGGRATGKPELF